MFLRTILSLPFFIVITTTDNELSSKESMQLFHNNNVNGPIQSNLPNNIQNGDHLNIYVSEFEIIEMLNHDGRLQNGFCCNGLRPVPGSLSGGCKGGNTTCLPFWRICIAEMQPDYQPAMNRELSTSSLNSTSTIDLSQPTTTTTKKPSLISNLFSKIFGGNGHKTPTSTSSNNVGDNRSKQIKDIIEHMSPTICQIGFWSSPPILPDTTFPIQMRKLLTLKMPAKHLGTISSRNFVSIVEIWSKNARNDVKNRLISRQINHYNIESNSLFNSDWMYGGKVFNSIDNLSSRNKDNVKNKIGSTSCSKQQRFRYRYRWHLKSIQQMRQDGYSIEELNLLNLTSEGCPQGYQGNDCNVPVCLEGCHQDHGYCEQPGQCSCRFGWTGMFCDYCLTLPGCVHGTCNRPLECRCEEGWIGMFCSIPKCKDGCHHSNGYCTKPGECKCKFGWQGENCTECSTLPGCQHGICEEPLDCKCLPGWQGTFCSTPICSHGCENGWCRRPAECRCKVGFKGENCTECVPYPGCKHGTCHDNKPWTCHCQPGYGGFQCDQLLNWCELNSQQHNNGTFTNDQGPCQNGGQCISVEQELGNYICKCPMGYTGKHCEQIIT